MLAHYSLVASCTKSALFLRVFAGGSRGKVVFDIIKWVG